MSVSASTRTRALALGLTLVVTIAACSVPSEPRSTLNRVPGKTLSIEGDTLQCPYGYVVINGRYVCTET